MKSEINAIKTLINSRNKSFKSEDLQLRVTEEIKKQSYSRATTWLTVSGYDASAYFAQMKPFLDPMICYVTILEADEVRLTFSK